MIFKKIYVEGSAELIMEILDMARQKLGDGCNAIDLNPILKEIGE